MIIKRINSRGLFYDSLFSKALQRPMIGWKISLKGYRRKWSWPNRDIIAAIDWRNWEKTGTTLLGKGSNRTPPKYEATALRYITTLEERQKFWQYCTFCKGLRPAKSRELFVWYRIDNSISWYRCCEGSWQGPLAGFCEQGNATTGCIICEEFVE
jgi:hypothetical protein